MQPLGMNFILRLSGLTVSRICPEGLCKRYNIIIHYLTVMDHLQCELNDIQEQITDLSETSASPQEFQHHQEMIRKTDGNLETQKIELSKRAERKLEKLRNPTTSVPKTKKSRKGKGHNPPGQLPNQPLLNQQLLTRPFHLPFPL